MEHGQVMFGEQAKHPAGTARAAELIQRRIEFLSMLRDQVINAFRTDFKELSRSRDKKQRLTGKRQRREVLLRREFSGHAHAREGRDDRGPDPDLDMQGAGIRHQDDSTWHR